MPSRASLKTAISRWENGHVTPHEPYASLLSEIYEFPPAELGIGAGELWLPLRLTEAASGSTTPEFVTGMQELLDDYARADNTMGPAQLVAAVQQHLAQLDAALLITRGDLRADVLRLCSRFAEFVGWLCHDAGNLDGAQRWTNRACDFLEESGDLPERAYVLMRKSAIAADRGELARSVSLVNAVTGHADEMSPRVSALVMRQSAISHALARDARASEMSVAKALESVASAKSEHDRYAYCTEPFVRMEAGLAAYHLHKYDAAADQLRTAAGAWPEGFQRDRGLCLGRLALVEAARGNVDVACQVGTAAVDLATSTSSARTRSVVRTLKRRLAPHARHTVVSEFADYSSRLV